MEKTYFGKISDGSDSYSYTFTNQNGMQMTVTDLGAMLIRVLVPDRDGKLQDVVLGYDTPQEYLEHDSFFGAIVGRSGNRIERGRFTINGTVYQLAINDNDNNLHSGRNHYHTRKWFVCHTEPDSITFRLLSGDGDQGFPGNFQIDVTYTLTADNTVEIHYEGISDADTVANLTNHTYFNLAGHASGTILDQQLQLDASFFTPVKDNRAIPTGEIRSVKDTPMDFTSPRMIGDAIDSDFDQLTYTGGYDHNYVIDHADGTIRKFAEAYAPESGISMEAFTDCFGVQFYAGNYIALHAGKDGAEYARRQGFCLETQYYPNAVNQPNFPSPILKAGEKYDTTTRYRFKTSVE
jgi:aldose 1-epimerase